MKLARYLTKDGPHVGFADGIGLMHPTPWRSFDELFALEDPVAAVNLAAAHLAEPVRPIRQLAPVVHRPQVVGVGGNYADHAAEASVEIQTEEPVFIPFMWGAVIGPDEDIVIPSAETFTDYEVEFSIVVGKIARRVTPEAAMDHVFGYTIVNDVSARDVTRRQRMQALLAKSPDTFLPVGPHIVTKDEIADPYTLKIESYLNDEVRQSSVTGNMTVRIPELLATLTAVFTLYPGDILTTGTPGGVGYFRSPPEAMRPGDVISARVEGIGALDNRVVAGYE